LPRELIVAGGSEADCS